MAPPPGKNAVYYVNPGGQIIKITDRMGRPNGVQLSPDGKVLYVADPTGEHVMAFDVQPDGTARNQREFARLHGVTRAETGVTSGADGIPLTGPGVCMSPRGSVFRFSARKDRTWGRFPYPV